jgi:ubiquinone/menaquinone biosynthesis C-methylase UbiE
LPTNHEITHVTRTKMQARQNYDRLSRFYDLFTGGAERRYQKLALERLHLTPGEIALEVGFGTGHILQQMAALVGVKGRIFGIDLSPGMLEISRQRLAEAGLLARFELACGDAMTMPYADNNFDAVFSSFTLELFDTPELLLVLAEIRRVLKPGGRLGILSMSMGEHVSMMLRVYEWFHRVLPRTVDCRPIYVERALKDAGFMIQCAEQVNLMDLPAKIVVGAKQASTD